jgi:HEAT repeat protein
MRPTHVRTAAALLVAATLVSAHGQARADVITLQTGDTIEGRVVGVTPRHVTVEVESGTILLDRSGVESIVEAPWAPTPDARPAPTAPATPPDARTRTGVKAVSEPPVAPRAGRSHADVARADDSAAAATEPSTPQPGQLRFEAALERCLLDPPNASADLFTRLEGPVGRYVVEALLDRAIPPVVRHALAEALDERTPDPIAVPWLVVLLHDRDTKVAQSAAWTLHALGPDAAESVGALRELANDAAMVPNLRGVALLALDKTGGEDAPHIAASLLSSPDASLRLRAREVLLGQRGQEVPADLHRRLNLLLVHTDAGVREDAVDVVAAIGDAYTRLRLVELARRDAAPAVRAGAVRGLTSQRSAEADEALLNALRDRSAEVRQVACAVLGSRNQEAAVATLLTMLYDLNSEVRKDAAAALEKITGEKHGTDVGSWRSWWQAEGERRFGEAAAGQG